jgi:hypothetical protein
MKLLYLAAAVIVLTAGCVQKYAVTNSGYTTKLRYITSTGDLTIRDALKPAPK